MKHLPTFLKRILPFYHVNPHAKVLESTYWLFFDQVLRMIVGFFVLIFVARQLGPEVFGTLNYALAFVSLFSVLSTLGIEKIIVRDVITDENEYKKILGTGFYLKLLGSSLLVLLATITSIILNPHDFTLNIIILLFSVTSIFQTFEIIEFWYQSRMESKKIVITKIIPFLIMSIGKIIVVLNTKSLVILSFLYLGETAFTAIGLVFLYTRSKKHFFKAFDFHRAKRMLQYSFPLIFSTIFVTIYLKIDQVFLRHLTTAEEVGIYSAAVRISELPFFIGTIITNSVFPLIIKSKSDSDESFNTNLQFLFSIVVYLGIFISIVITLIAPYLINSIFGSEYSGAILILRIHIWSLLFVYLGVAQSVWIIATNNTKVSFVATATGAVVNIILNLILIPRYQAAGAAIATLISYAISGYLINFFIKNARSVGILQTNAFSPLLLLHELQKRKLI